MISHSEFLTSELAQALIAAIQERAKRAPGIEDDLTRALTAVIQGDEGAEDTARQALDNATPGHRRTDLEAVPVGGFTCGLSELFWNKRTLSGEHWGTTTSSYKTHLLTPAQFRNHVLAGKAWSPGYFAEAGEINRAKSKENFLGAQLFALDCDKKLGKKGVHIQTALGIGLIAAYAMLIYETPSSAPEHGRCRIVFVNERPYDNVVAWEKAQEALVRYFDFIQPDHAWDGARQWYGSAGAGHHFNAQAVLPQVVLDSIIEFQESLSRPKQPSKPKREGQGDDIVGKIKSRIDLVDYIGGYVPLKKSGARYKALCPFHTEKTPSFIISPDKGLWTCFGACHTSGDVISFAQRWHNLDFPATLRMLAQEAGA